MNTRSVQSVHLPVQLYPTASPPQTGAKTTTAHRGEMETHVGMGEGLPLRADNGSLAMTLELKREADICCRQPEAKSGESQHTVMSTVTHQITQSSSRLL